MKNDARYIDQPTVVFPSHTRLQSLLDVLNYHDFVPITGQHKMYLLHLTTRNIYLSIVPKRPKPAEKDVTCLKSNKTP